MKDNPLYRINQISKSYGTRQVLAIDQLEIYQGEIVALVGPSGAGKSTFLRLLNFLEPPTQGHIYFHNELYSAEKEMPIALRRRVTMVFQRPMLLNRSIEANVNYGPMLRGIRDSRARVRSALAEVGLEHIANQNAHKLSGGEAQRVALARAMVIQPEVLLLDEPTANLDPYNVGVIEKICQHLNKIHQTTLIFVTHNIFQARRLAQRVIFLLDGKVIEVASVGAFFNHPDDSRTAAFVRGEMIY